MIVTLSGAGFRRLVDGGWPDLCSGCGDPAPRGTFPAWMRRNTMGSFQTAAAFAGGEAEYTTYRLRLPACLRCRRRGHLGPLVFAAVCVALVVIGLTNGNARFDDDGAPVVGLTRALRLAGTLGLASSIFLGPPLFLVLQRRLSPALIADLRGASWDTLEAIDLDVGSEAFARAALERAGPG